MSVEKIQTFNLERGYPAAEDAVRNMTNLLATCKRRGVKAALLIHGYGSSGAGGEIKKAVKNKLKEPSMIGIVRAVCPGEEWVNNKNAFISLCPGLKEYESRVSGNFGVTVVLLK